MSPSEKKEANLKGSVLYESTTWHSGKREAMGTEKDAWLPGLGVGDAPGARSTVGSVRPETEGMAVPRGLSLRDAPPGVGAWQGTEPALREDPVLFTILITGSKTSARPGATLTAEVNRM